MFSNRQYLIRKHGIKKPHIDIAIICDYLHHDEKKHYEEYNRPQAHIWHRIKRVERWLKQLNEKI